MKIIITILILYLLYKLVFDFIVPVSKTTSQFKNQVNEMKRMQEEKMRRQQSTTPPPPPKKAGTSTNTDAEYIDFEDVK